MPSPANAPSRGRSRANGSWRSQPERLGEQRVVADLRMGVERQVVGGQGDVVLEQRAQRARRACGVSPAGWKSQNRPWWTSTSSASSATARSISSRCADTPVTTWSTVSRARDLQPVRPVVLECTGIQQLVEVADQLGDVDRRGFKWHDERRSCQLNVEFGWLRCRARGRHSTRHGTEDGTVGRGTMVMDAPVSATAGRRRSGRPTPCSSPPSAAATIAPSSSSTRATSAASPPTCSAWSRTTAAPRTSRRRSSSPRCAACARPTGAIAFKPWIYEIAKNACIDQFRRSRRAEEVSLDAGEGLGHADHGRLVAAEPTPDAAVDAKQQLDHLCGAFGGLSDSHHEILVLREFEGLSYREIGDRMGLSRPGVESTLFRARKRLSEEYDELVSGQRCTRIQSIIAAAEPALGAGTRDPRRLARHISHCQPCRRMAVASGLDAAAIPRKPVRRAIERAAGFLPLPAFLRARFFAAASRWCRSPSRWPPPGPRPWPSRRRCWSPASARASPRSRAASGPRPSPRAPSPPPAARTSRPRRRTARGGRRARVAAPRPREVDDPHRRPERLARHARGAPRLPAAARPAAARPAAARPRARRASHCAGGGQPDPRHAEPDARRPRADGRRHADAGRRACRRSSCPRSDPGVGSTQVGGPVEQTVSDAASAVDQTTGQRAGHGRRRDGRAAHAVVSRAVADTGADSFVESLMDTNLYSIGAYFNDRHPELVDSVVDEAAAIERDGLEGYATAGDLDARDRVPDARHGPGRPLLPSGERLE